MIIIIFIIGLIFGSFYTVVGLRLPNNESIIKPGSHCPKCNHSLKWYELIPILSYIIQKGKCRNCNIKMALMYPVMEFLTGFLFAFCYFKFGFEYKFFLGIITSSVMIIIFVSDIKYFIILDSPLLIGSILILITKWYFSGLKLMFLSLGTGVILFLFMWLIKIIGDKAFKREALGGGDVKLAFFTGCLLAVSFGTVFESYVFSFALGLLSLIAASFIAFPYALYALFTNKEKEIPFGPFLVLGILIVFLFSDKIINYITYVLLM